jgi:predicted DNA-binding transcriptional regulator AlpA
MERSAQGASACGIDGLSDNALVRLNNLHSLRLVPFSSSTVWRKVRKGEFPTPIKISPGVTAWRVADLKRWLANPADYNESKSQRLGEGRQE